MSKQSLKNKTLKGTFWSTADAFLGQGITFIVGIVLARLLSPAEYGLIGVVLIFTTVLTGVVDSGFSSAIIRKKDTTDEDYNTMFATNMVISLLMMVLLFFTAPVISTFFNNKELTALLRVMSIILVIQALSIVQVTILTKRIDFKTKTKASFVSAVSSGIIGICMAFNGYGVWSLVGQKISNIMIYTICLWKLNRWYPSFLFSKKSFQYMWGFGWKMTLSGLINNIWNQLYPVVVGKCYSPATLGQYSQSRDYSNLFSTNFTLIIQRVTYPALSELQDDKEKMVAAYRKVIKISMFVTATCMISLGAVAEPFIYTIIGKKWHLAASFLPLICLSMSLYPLHAINLNMLQIQGRSDIFLILEIIKKTISILPLCLGVFVSIYWMLIGSIFTGVICFFLNTYYTGKKLNYSSWMQLKDIAPSYGVAFIIALSMYFLKFLPLSYVEILAIQIITGATVLFLVGETTKMEEYYEVKNIAKSFILKIKE